MRSTVRTGVAAIALMLSACSGSGTTPTGPTAFSQPTAVSVPAPTPKRTFPPASGPSRTFTFERELTYHVQDYTKNSRFVLYDNGAFVLQYTGRAEYHGGYTAADGEIEFEWDGSYVGAAPDATGTLDGDQLTVKYNEAMQLSDFENAVYARVP